MVINQLTKKETNMKRIAFLMVALLMMGGITAMAQGHRGDHKRMTPQQRAEKMTERMVKEYSLNDTQKAQLLQLNLAQCEKMDGRMSMHSKKAMKKDMKKDGKKDMKKDGQKNKKEAPKMTQEEREKMRAEMKAAKENYNVQLQKIMTPDQYASYLKKQSEREQRMKEGRGQRK